MLPIIIYCISSKLILVLTCVDDLFDEEDLNKPVEKEVKRKYLDEKWELTSEDNEALEGYNKNLAELRGQTVPSSSARSSGNAGVVQSLQRVQVEDDGEKPFPCFGVVYFFKPEYLDVDIDGSLKEHLKYCEKFQRIMNSEVLQLDKRKGVVTLWVALDKDDGKQTEEEIKRFVEGDPLVIQNLVQEWEIFPLTSSDDDISDEDREKMDEFNNDRIEKLKNKVAEEEEVGAQ